MALSLRHWVAAALLACAGITVALWPAGVPDGAGSSAPAPTARRQISSALSRAYHDALYLGRRDEALAALAPALRRSPGADRGAITLVVDPRRSRAVSSVRARAIAAAFDSLAPLLANGDRGVRVAVFVTADTGFGTPAGYVGFRGPWYIVPEGTDGHTCLVVLPGGVGSRIPLRTASSMLGPCAFYAAFGIPGPAITRWLAAVGYTVADEADWTRTPPRRGVGGAADIEEALRYSTWFEILQRSATLGMSLHARGCAVGKHERCRDLMDAAAWPPSRRAGAVHGLAQAAWWPGWDEREWYLADLVRGMGHDRFARFWSSPLPRDSAFAEAFGVSMEEWTQQWLREPNPEVRAGPAIRASSVVLGLLVAGVLVAGGAFYVTRRAVA